MKPMPNPGPCPNIQRPPGPPGPLPSKEGWNGPSPSDAAKLLLKSEKPEGTVVNADDASSNAVLPLGALDSLHAAMRAAHAAAQVSVTILFMSQVLFESKGRHGRRPPP